MPINPLLQNPMGGAASPHGYGGMSALFGSGATTDGASAGATRAGRIPDAGEIRRQVESLLAEVPRNGAKLSFDDVLAHRDALKSQLEERVATDLAAMGIDTSKNLTFGMTPNGAMVVAGDHAQKEQIDRYLAATPDVRDLYQRSLKLSKLGGVAESQLTPRQLRTQMQATAMQTWFETNGGDALVGLSGGLAAQFGGGRFTPLGGVNTAA